MHPLKQYLRDVEEGFQDFAARVGVSRQTLYRIVSGAQAPKPMLARRIVEATGGAGTLDLRYGGAACGGAEVVGFTARQEEPLLDPERLRLAVAVVINHLRAEEDAAPGAAMLAIAAEIRNIRAGVWPDNDNPLVNAPHTAAAIMADDWSHPYSRQQAGAPAGDRQANKYWPPVGRVDNAFGDRNLICACPLLNSWEDAAE